MDTPQKETPTSGSNHAAGVNTHNDVILPILDVLYRIAFALERNGDLIEAQNEVLENMQIAIEGISSC